MGGILMLVDAYALIYRAFYAIPSLTGPHGQPVNAVFGFIKMVRKLLADHQPTHVAVVYDLGPPQKRLAILPSYKEQRPPTPPDLEAQLPSIRGALEAMQLPVVEREGEEADDLLATLAAVGEQRQCRVLIASHDKDFFQLVGPRVFVVRSDAREPVIYDVEAVKRRYGVSPDQIVDLLSLVGDDVDNIPGVPGIGLKTAASLLNQFGNLENLLANLNELPTPRVRDALAGQVEQLRRNRGLITLDREVSLPVSFDELQWQEPDRSAMVIFCRTLGFRTLASELEGEGKKQGDLFADA